MTSTKHETENIEELKRWNLEHIWQVLRPHNILSAPGGFTIFKEGNGCRLTDINGRTYLDFYACIMFNNVGWGRKEIAETVYENMVRLHFTPTHEPTIPKIKLAKKLAEITPGSLSKVFFGLGGTDAGRSNTRVTIRILGAVAALANLPVEGTFRGGEAAASGEVPGCRELVAVYGVGFGGQTLHGRLKGVPLSDRQSFWDGALLATSLCLGWLLGEDALEGIGEPFARAH